MKQPKWKKEFIKEFVNDHGDEWRPLRGLWVEQIFEFISKLLAKEQVEILNKAIAIFQKLPKDEVMTKRPVILELQVLRDQVIQLLPANQELQKFIDGKEKK